MSLTRRVHPEAAAELLKAAEWYEAERAELGGHFLSHVEAAERQLLEWPDAAPVLPGWDQFPVVRSANVRVFPYRVVYYRTGSEAVIIAYPHTRRRPRYWKHRLDT